MPWIRFDSIPQTVGAHTFRAPEYHNTLGRPLNRIEITYIKEGTLSIENSDEAGTAHVNDIICNLHQSCLHVNSDTPHCHSTMSFYLPFSVLEACPEDDKIAFLLPLIVTPGSESGLKMRSIIEEIIRIKTLHTKDAERDLYCSGQILRLLSLISMDARHMDGGQKSGSNPYIHRAMEYIYRHLEEPIREEAVASFLDISPEYLCTLFRKELGTSLLRRVNEIKLERIRTLILREGVSLGCASELYGYSDPNYVSRLYRRYFGITLSDSLRNGAKKSEM